MNFTKQDIQKLSSMLSRLSVKDSQFPKAKILSEDARVPVLDDGINQTASAKLLSKWVAKNIDLSDIFVQLNGAESSNLLSLLAEILRYAKTYKTDNGQWLVAEQLICNQTFMNQDYNLFSDLLPQILRAIEDIYLRLKYAEPADIERIFT